MPMKKPILWGAKRYHSLNYHFRGLFNDKVFKVPLDGGFTCPNRDGTVGYGGCIFCSSRGSGDFAGERYKDLKHQFNDVVQSMHKKWPNAKYIGYLQAFSSTYAPVEDLRRSYMNILEEQNVVGISIATRPDCISEDVLSLLEEINSRTHLWVELGLQTIHEKTQKLINRGHDYQIFLDTLYKLREKNIEVIVHIILNLPGEEREDMLQTARAVANLPIQGLKIHMLHLLEGTPMVNLYEKGKLKFMSREEYIELIVDILELLPPNIVIHRLTGDGPPNLLIEPLWTLKKWEVLNAIDDELERRNSWQGKDYINKS